MLVSPRASGVCCCPCLRLTHTIIYISFGFPRMDVFYLGRFRPRHVHRPSAAHSRSGGEVHVCRKVWQTRKVTIRTRYWLYSQPSFAAPTINWSWRGSYSAGYALLHSRGTYSKRCFTVSDGLWRHFWTYNSLCSWQSLRWLRASVFAGYIRLFPAWAWVIRTRFCIRGYILKVVLCS